MIQPCYASARPSAASFITRRPDRRRVAGVSVQHPGKTTKRTKRLAITLPVRCYPRSPQNRALSWVHPETPTEREFVDRT